MNIWFFFIPPEKYFYLFLKWLILHWGMVISNTKSDDVLWEKGFVVWPNCLNIFAYFSPTLGLGGGGGITLQQAAMPHI